MSDSDIQIHQRVICDITSHPFENQILIMLRGSIPMDLSWDLESMLSYWRIQLNLCSHNFLQTKNRRLIKKAGITRCSVRYDRYCRRDCLTTRTIVASMSWYVHICSTQFNSKSNHGASATNFWVEGTLVLYSWSYILASMFGVRRPVVLH